MPQFLVTSHATATIAEDWLVTASNAATAQRRVEYGGVNKMILIEERTVGEETDREVVQIASFEEGATIPVPTPDSAVMKAFVEQIAQMERCADPVASPHRQPIDDALNDLIEHARAMLAEAAR